MQLLVTILSLVLALVPIADREVQQYRGRQVSHTVMKPVLESPPERGQANVVFYNGDWWKYENGVWFVWRPQPQYNIAQGGYTNAVR
jgi:hypothetical protein